MDIVRWCPEESKKWTDEQGRKIAIEEITVRVRDGQMVLMPTAFNIALIVGIFAEAKKRFDFEIYAIGCLTNHIHYLIGIRDSVHRAKIMEFIHAHISGEVGWHGDFGKFAGFTKKPGGLWAKKGAPIQAMTDAELVQRLKYVLAQGTKEGLVARPQLAVWLNSALTLCNGDRVHRGIWINRTELTAMRKRHGADYPEESCTTHYELELSKLPTLRHLDDQTYGQFVKGVCNEIATEARTAFGPTHRLPVPQALINVNPNRCVGEPKDKKPAPPCHCGGDKEIAKAYLKAYRLFVAAYREAHHELKDAIREGRPFTGEFPPGCVRPTDLMTATQAAPPETPAAPAGA